MNTESTTPANEIPAQSPFFIKAQDGAELDQKLSAMGIVSKGWNYYSATDKFEVFMTNGGWMVHKINRILEARFNKKYNSKSQIRQRNSDERQAAH